jgi:thioesterase domain-containing protein
MVGRITTELGKTLQGVTSQGTPPSEGSLSRALQEVLKANQQALRTYVPQVYPGRIILFLSSEAPERAFYDRRLGWSDMTTEGLEVHVVPGSHETLFGEPHVRVLAQKLQGCLQKVQAAQVPV